MEKFLLKYSNVPKKFIDDFFNIAKEEYIDNIPSINLDKVCTWLDCLKANLKRLLKARNLILNHQISSPNNLKPKNYSYYLLS